MLFNKNELLARARSLKYLALANEKVAKENLNLVADKLNI